MSITKILTDSNASADYKLTSVAKIVADAQKAYGNSEAKIEPPTVHTVYGVMSFINLDDNSKVAMLITEINAIKVKALEAVEQTPGAVIDKEIEKFLATSPMFVNIKTGTKFKYI